MKKLLKPLLITLSLLFAFHFLITFAFLLSGMIPGNQIRKITAYYMLPFFDQNWAMFSVPGGSNKFILFKYRLLCKHNPAFRETDWLDVSSPLRESNKQHYFSFYQRLIKYSSGCINDIYSVTRQTFTGPKKECPRHLNGVNADSILLHELTTNSAGYSSLRLYACKVFETLSIPDKEKFDSLAFSLKIVDDAFPDYANRKKNLQDTNNHTYTELKIDYAPLF